MKYSKKFNRDYDFYMINKDSFTFSGVSIDIVEEDPQGVTSKESFHSFDTKGKILPTCEPDLLRSIIICKKSINLHIKMWVEGYDEMMEGMDFYMSRFQGTPPKWVEQSFRNQLWRKLKQRCRKSS